MNYNHLTTFQRARIETLYNFGYSRRYIANLIGMHHSTVNRGKEFACYSSVEKNLDIKVFFADPYSSLQRDSNENSIDLLLRNL